MTDVKAKIEAILFCLPQGISTRALAQKLNLGSAGAVKSALKKLQKEYEERNAGLIIVEESGFWKFKVPDNYIDLIKDAAEPEFHMAVLETLASNGYAIEKLTPFSLIFLLSPHACNSDYSLVSIGVLKPWGTMIPRQGKPSGWS